MYLLYGALGFFAVLGGLFGLAHGAARLAARWLGAGTFCWFDGEPLGAARWRAALVRTLSSLAPIVGALVLLTGAYLAAGQMVPTTSVDVVPGGPAASAGVLTGDRILSVGGKPIRSFDDIRLEVQRGSEERALAIERRGQRLSIRVTPRNGRIGVTPISERREHSARTAFGQALRAPAATWGAVVSRVLEPKGPRTELAGPIGIVRSVESQPGSGSVLLLLGLLAVYFSPFFAGVHVVDALSLAVFLKSHAWATAPGAEPGVRRLARLYQTLTVSLLAAALVIPLAIVQELPFGGVAVPMILFLMPVVLSLTFIVAIVAGLRWRRSVAIAVLVPSCSIPCAVFGVASWFAYWLKQELTRKGFRVNALGATPEAQ